jgi:putative nucleotidyltransferase with HDIG domain
MKRAKFDKLMSKAGELPTLPVVAQKVLEVIRDEGSNARVLTEYIELDPIISAKLLRLANSAYYRSPNADEVADVHRAIVVLGFMNIRNIVLTTCLRSLYSPEFRSNHFTARDLWIHSVMVAVTARTLAKYVFPTLADEAFMAGLVHDIGMIVEWTLFPDRFPQVLARFQGTGLDFQTAEQQTLGFDHCESGAAILRKWRLPKNIRDAAARHHNLKRRANCDNVLPELIHVAERICCSRGDGFFDFLKDDHDIKDVLDHIGLAEEAYATIVEDTDGELEKARDLLNL